MSSSVQRWRECSVAHRLTWWQATRAAAQKPIVDAMKDGHRHRHKRAYGSPRMVDALRSRGYEISRRKTARLMR